MGMVQFDDFEVFEASLELAAADGEVLGTEATEWGTKYHDGLPQWEMTMKELGTVVLCRDLPEEGLEAGDVCCVAVPMTE